MPYSRGKAPKFEIVVMNITFLPLFPQLRELVIHDHDLLRPYFESIPPEISDHTFTSLFMWRHYFKTKICAIDNSVGLFCDRPGKEFFFPPFEKQHVHRAINIRLEAMESMGKRPKVRRASEGFIERYLSDQSRFLVKEISDSYDYVYLTENLIKLSGRRYNGQRNFIKRFKKNYPNFSVEILNEDNIPECVEFGEEWFVRRHSSLILKENKSPEEEEFLEIDLKATRDALLNFHVLPIVGMAVRIDGKIRGFCIGERLNQETAVVHIEKADHHYCGLSQFISQAFCQRFWAGCTYINREEDLGLEGLRRAKLALGPHHFKKKHSITWNKQK